MLVIGGAVAVGDALVVMPSEVIVKLVAAGASKRQLRLGQPVRRGPWVAQKRERLQCLQLVRQRLLLRALR